jgi:hypothetical protein
MGDGKGVGLGTAVAVGVGSTVGTAGAAVGADGAQAERIKIIMISSLFMIVSETSLGITRISYHTD